MGERRLPIPDSGNALKPTRRQAIIGAVGLAGVGGSLYLIPEEAQADVTIEEFTVKDSEFEEPSIDPLLEVEGEYEYAVAREPDGTDLELLIDGELVDRDRTSFINHERSSSYSLSGNVIESPDLEEEDFITDAGESVTHEIEVTVALAVYSEDGVALNAKESDTAEITVTNPVEEETIGIDGEGEIRDTS